jgi:hypothetical protein
MLILRWTILPADGPPGAVHSSGTIYSWLQYFDRETLRAEIESRGLVVEELLGDVAGAAYDPAGHEFAAVAMATDERR